MLTHSGTPCRGSRYFPREALAKARSIGERLDGAIIDLGLPDRPGDELVREIRAWLPEPPIIVTTGYANHDLRDRSAHDPHLQILAKPFDLHSLTAALARFGIRLRKLQ